MKQELLCKKMDEKRWERKAECLQAFGNRRIATESSGHRKEVIEEEN